MLTRFKFIIYVLHVTIISIISLPFFYLGNMALKRMDYILLKWSIDILSYKKLDNVIFISFIVLIDGKILYFWKGFQLRIDFSLTLLLPSLMTMLLIEVSNFRFAIYIGKLYSPFPFEKNINTAAVKLHDESLSMLFSSIK